MKLDAKRIKSIRKHVFVPENYKTSWDDQDKEVGLFKFIWKLLKGIRVPFIIMVIAINVEEIFDWLTVPVFSKLVVSSIENYTGDKMNIMSAVLKPLIIYFTAIITSDIIGRLSGWYWHSRFKTTLNMKIKMTFLDRITRNKYEYFTYTENGKITNILFTLSFNIEKMIHVLVCEIMTHFSTSIVVLTTMLFIHWKLSLIVISYFAILMLFFIFFTYPRIIDKTARSMKSGNKLFSNIIDVLMNITSVLVFCRKDFELKRLKRLQNYDSKRKRALGLFTEQMKIFFMITTIIFIDLLFFLTMFDLYKHSLINLSDIVFLITTVWMCIELMFCVQKDILEFSDYYGTTKEALAMLNAGPIVENPKGSDKKLIITDGKIDFHDISFKYGKKKVFDKENIIVLPKQKVGIVGKSGAGKTTLTNLLLNNLKPQGGKILIDGQDISKCTDESIKNNISLISQTTLLFNRSVIENIRYSKPEATFEEVIEAAKKANAHEFIMNLPAGYSTGVGEQGMLLSGGQRQRIIIARAILKNAPILVLDEATSALDAENEEIINESLSELMKNKTVFAIAHKLNTLVKMDNILVLQKGKIVEQGTHKELIKKNGVYSHLWSMQHDGDTILKE